MGLTLPFDPAESAQASRLAWAIERYATSEITPEQIEATHEFDPGYGLVAHLRRFRVFRRPIDEVVSYEPDPIRPRAVVRSGKDMMVVIVRLGDAPERRIVSMSLSKVPPPGVATRLADESDGPALRDLERRCAVESGGISLYYDRGTDYFAQQRLMAHQLTSVAEYRGRIVGVLSDAIHHVRVAGIEYRATYRFHLRIDPEARGLGIFPGLNASQGFHLLVDRPMPIATNFVAAENEQMLATAGPDQNASRWATPVERLVLSCHDNAGPPAGRRASPADASRIAGLLAASHGAEELAPTFDEAWAVERMSRSPGDYSWANIILSERAVLGVWDSGIRIMRSSASGSTETRTATALDWGFAPGGEAESEELLRAACSDLASKGVDDLVIFSSPPSRGRPLLSGLARVIEPFLVSAGGIMPRTDATNGIYVDPIYF